LSNGRLDAAAAGLVAPTAGFGLAAGAFVASAAAVNFGSTGAEGLPVADMVGVSLRVARSSTDGPRRLENVSGGVAIDSSELRARSGSAGVGRAVFAGAWGASGGNWAGFGVRGSGGASARCWGADRRLPPCAGGFLRDVGFSCSSCTWAA
jgi:hypothetical protein